jgi:hypothetical protein
VKEEGQDQMSRIVESVETARIVPLSVVKGVYGLQRGKKDDNQHNSLRLKVEMDDPSGTSLARIDRKGS